jgi:hypothetical protein
MFPALLLCLDGGTWASASGVSVSEKERNHFLSSLTRFEQQRPYQRVWLEVEDTVRAWCERTRPGDKAFLQVALCGLDVKSTHALAQITIEKPRANTTAEMGGRAAWVMNPRTRRRHHQRLAFGLVSLRNRGSNKEELQPQTRPGMRRMPGPAALSTCRLRILTLRPCAKLESSTTSRIKAT